MSLLNINTAVINSYREAARAGQRGMKRMQRKVNAQKARVAFLEDFIEKNQLSHKLAITEQRIRDEKHADWIERTK